MSKNKKIVFGVSGGIAAYKAADLVSNLTKKNYDISVIMTKNATKLIGPATFRALSKNPVLTKMFDNDNSSVPHIDLATAADLFIIAPATANTIGKIANGIADNILTTTIMACSAPKIIVPAMNNNMWENKIVQENITKLNKHGYTVIEPAEGNLACGTSGKGRYPENQKIIETIEKLLK